jgi:hypothetical protein
LACRDDRSSNCVARIMKKSLLRARHPTARASVVLMRCDRPT